MQSESERGKKLNGYNKRANLLFGITHVNHKHTPNFIVRNLKDNTIYFYLNFMCVCVVVFSRADMSIRGRHTGKDGTINMQQK